MNNRQIFPFEPNEETDEFRSSLNIVTSLRNIRLTSHQTTQLISPKNIVGQLQPSSPKRSLYASQDRIIEEDQHQLTEGSSKQKLQRAIRRLLMILLFYRSSAKQSEDDSRLQHHFRRSLLPFYPDDKFIQLWTRIIYCSTFISTILYPLNFGFTSGEIDWLVVAVLILDIIFFIDIILNMITCQIDNNNMLIKNYVGILIFNLYGWTLIDIISAMPYYFLIRDGYDNYDDINYIVLFKLFRIVKYFLHSKKQYFIVQGNSEHTNQDATDDDGVPLWDEFIIGLDMRIVSIVKIFVNMLMLINLFGCLWQFIAKFDIYLDNTMESTQSTYINSLYWAIQTVTVVGYGDVIATTSAELNLTIIWMFVGVGFYSFTIGNISSILSDQQINEEGETELETLDEMFNSISIPYTLQTQALEYLYYNYEKNPFWLYKSILKTLPNNLRNCAIVLCQRQLIRSIPYFQIDLNFVSEVMPSFSINFYKQYETIYSIGSYSLEIYFLVTGEVRLTNLEGDTLLNIHEGFIFGEMEGLESVGERFTHAVVSRDSIIIGCPIDNFLIAVYKRSQLAFELEQLSLRRQILIKETKEKLHILRTKLKHQKCIRENNESSKTVQLIQKKAKLEYEFKQHMKKDTFQQAQKYNLIIYRFDNC